MPTYVPIKDMKDTVAFARTVEQAAIPATVTRNGYDAFVVMRSDDYEALREELARMRLMERIARAEHEFATGRYADGASFVKDIRERYGL